MCIPQFIHGNAINEVRFTICTNGQLTTISGEIEIVVVELTLIDMQSIEHWEAKIKKLLSGAEAIFLS